MENANVGYQSKNRNFGKFKREREVSTDKANKLQPMGQKIYPPPDFVNKILFKHRLTHPFKSCLWWGQSLAAVTETSQTAMLELLIIWLFREKVCQPSSSANQFKFLKISFYRFLFLIQSEKNAKVYFVNCVYVTKGLITSQPAFSDLSRN